MRTEDMILVSVDDHIVEPPDMWDKVDVPKKYRDQVPKVVHTEQGTDVWTYEGNQIPNIGLNAVAGRPPEEWGFEPTAFDEIRDGCFDVDKRVDDMNANGVLASLNFPSFVQFCGQLFSRSEDKDLAIEMVRAYNDWHIDHWAGSHPGRFIPLSIPPIWDPKLMAAEVERVAEKGCHAVTFSENPAALGWPSWHDKSHWEPFFATCEETETTICLHIGSSSKLIQTSPDAPFDVLVTLTPQNSVQAVTDVLYSGVLERYPNIKIALSEGGVGWLPYFLERVDYVYQQHRTWLNQDFGDMLPSQLVKRNFTFCFIDDKHGIEARDKIGVENITWECDYPHSDSSWPQSPETVEKHFAEVDISDEEINMITHENALRVFKFDPFQHIPRDQATVGALRELGKDVDLTLKSSERHQGEHSKDISDFIDVGKDINKPNKS